MDRTKFPRPVENCGVCLYEFMRDPPYTCKFCFKNLCRQCVVEYVGEYAEGEAHTCEDCKNEKEAKTERREKLLERRRAEWEKLKDYPNDYF
jgi:hypothetical protein